MYDICASKAFSILKGRQTARIGSDSRPNLWRRRLIQTLIGGPTVFSAIAASAGEHANSATVPGVDVLSDLDAAYRQEAQDAHRHMQSMIDRLTNDFQAVGEPAHIFVPAIYSRSAR